MIRSVVWDDPILSIGDVIRGCDLKINRSDIPGAALQTYKQVRRKVLTSSLSTRQARMDLKIYRQLNIFSVVKQLWDLSREHDTVSVSISGQTLLLPPHELCKILGQRLLSSPAV